MIHGRMSSECRVVYLYYTAVRCSCSGAVRSPVSCSCRSQRCYVRVWWHSGPQRTTTRHLSVSGTCCQL